MRAIHLVKHSNRVLEMLQRTGLLGKNTPTIPNGGIGTGALTALKTLDPTKHARLINVFNNFKLLITPTGG
jgi:hypothetical protein